MNIINKLGIGNNSIQSGESRQRVFRMVYAGSLLVTVISFVVFVINAFWFISAITSQSGNLSSGENLAGLGQAVYCMISAFVLLISIPVAIISKMASKNGFKRTNSRSAIYSTLLIMTAILIYLIIYIRTH